MIYKNTENVLEERWHGEVMYLVYPSLEKTGIVKHGFSTRIGGVSKEHLGTMNLSFTRGDEEEEPIAIECTEKDIEEITFE